ncbi:hypothetical protein BC828DRAFT_439065 [Blastocladiella britannica]|nr:hypothetical protein BC828DRAFT_439065 [Blastocladiella britannica]
MITKRTTDASTLPWKVPPPTSAALAVMSTFLTPLFAGALLLQLAWALCRHPRPRKMEWALHIAAGSQLFILLLSVLGARTRENVVWPPDPNAPLSGVAPAFTTATQVVVLSVFLAIEYMAMMLTVLIMYHRAQAIALVSPIAANWVAPILSVAVAVSHLLSFVYVVVLVAMNPATLTDTQVAELWAGISILWAIASQLSAVLAFFSEGYVTSVIAKLRTASQSQRRRQKRRGCGGSRLIYAALTCVMFLANAVLTLVGLFGVLKWSSPFAMPGWVLILVRIYEFRSELLRPPTILVSPVHTMQPPARRSTRDTACAPNNGTQTSAMPWDPSRSSTSIARYLAVADRQRLLQAAPTLVSN